MHNISAKAYETLRNVFILPSRKSIDDHFKKNDDYLMKCLQNIEKVPNLIKKYKQLYNISGFLDCVMSKSKIPFICICFISSAA